MRGVFLQLFLLILHIAGDFDLLTLTACNSTMVPHRPMVRMKH